MSFTAKSVILDIADNLGDSYLGFRQMDFYSGGALISLVFADSDYTAYATSTYASSGYEPEFAFDTSLSRIGSAQDNEWFTSSNTNQRLICVFDSAITFDEIRVTNSHHNGSSTNRGVNNVVVNISSDAITDTTYNASIANSTEVFNGQFDEYAGSEQTIVTAPIAVTYDSNGADGGTVPTDSTDYSDGDTVTVLDKSDLTNTGYSFVLWSTTADGSGTTYNPGDTFTINSAVTLFAIWYPANVVEYTAKSVILDIADTWGATRYLGLRQVDFWCQGYKLNLSPSDYTAYETTFTSYSATNAFDTSTSKDGSGSAGWLSGDGDYTNQRLICVFNSAQDFDAIRVNNYHHDGGNTDRGAKNVVITISTDNITDTTYNASVSSSTEIFNSQFDQHEALNAEDEQLILGRSFAPLVTTDSASGIDSSSAILNGTIDNLGPFASLDVYFEWGTTTSYGNTTANTTLSSTGSFSDTISGLTEDQTYHFRAAVTDGVDTWYGDDATFTTEKNTVVAGHFTTVGTLGGGRIVGDTRTVGHFSIISDLLGDGGLLSRLFNCHFFATNTLTGSVEFNQVTAGHFQTKGTLTSVGLRSFSAGRFQATGILNGSYEVIKYENFIALFKFYVTGTADGLTDAKIPISSFQIRLYKDKNSYLSVNIPGVGYTDQITNRPNGTLKLYLVYAKIDTMEEIRSEVLLETTMDTPRVDEGSINNSIKLEGHETDAQATARQAISKTITLSESWLSYRRSTGTSWTARLVKPHLDLRAGDTVIDDGISYTADRITWMKSESVHHMEITGATV